MTDRELLELAAKAVGIDKYWHHYDLNKSSLLVPTSDGEYADEWNPLHDDGDALRLAVKLRIDVEHNQMGDDSCWVMSIPPGWMKGPTEEFDDESNRGHITRLVITKAAAEIGRTMP